METMNSPYKVCKNTAYSNIAFVKYWGKHGRQLPLNPSISMPIKQCRSMIEVQWKIGNHLKIESFLFNGESNLAFSRRFEHYLSSLEDVYPLATKLELKIVSENNFPHSAGIASSASAFAAFAKCLVSIEESVFDQKQDQERASFLARLGSGSACRSLSETPFTLWGETHSGLGSDQYALDLDPKKYQFSETLLDTILIVDEGEKKVSSSDGHALMDAHPFKESRVQQAHKHINELIESIANNDLKTFGKIIEAEALSLHALMMTSEPSYTLLSPDSLKLIELIKAYREKHSIPMYFTLDAGPNIHLIYPENVKLDVDTFIHSSIQPLGIKVLMGES